MLNKNNYITSSNIKRLRNSEKTCKSSETRTNDTLIIQVTKTKNIASYILCSNSTEIGSFLFVGVAKLRFAPSRTLITKDESVGEHDEPIRECIHFKE